MRRHCSNARATIYIIYLLFVIHTLVSAVFKTNFMQFISYMMAGIIAIIDCCLAYTWCATGHCIDPYFPAHMTLYLGQVSFPHPSFLEWDTGPAGGCSQGWRSGRGSLFPWGVAELGHVGEDVHMLVNCVPLQHGRYETEWAGCWVYMAMLQHGTLRSPKILK